MVSTLKVKNNFLTAWKYKKTAWFLKFRLWGLWKLKIRIQIEMTILYS